MLQQFLTHLSLSVLILIGTTTTLQAQVTIYDATFSGNGSRSGSASGQVGGSWSATPRSGGCLNDADEFFGTRNGSFEITNFEGSGCSNGQGGNNDSEWRTNPINIRNYSNINVTVELSGIAGGSGFDGSPNKCVPFGSSDCIDQIRVLVSVDGESFSSPTYRPNSNSFSATYDEAQGVCGNQLLVRVIGGTQAANESFFIDRVLVTGDRGGKPFAQNSTVDACIGEDVVLRIANASNNAQIEWLDNEGDEIPSARNRNTLVINNVKEEDTGLYAAIVLDPDAGCSTPVFLEYEVFILPSLSQPASLSISESVACIGQSVDLIASPSGEGFEYAWAGPDGEEIERCRNLNVCKIDNVSLSDAGPYLVLLGNPDAGECALGEAEVSLEVTEGPGQVTSSMPSFSFCEGENIKIEITTSNTGDYNYTWQSPDGTQQQANGTNGSLILDDIQTTNAGSYQLLVSNLDGSCSAELNDGNGVRVVVNEGIEQPIISSLGDACDALPTLQVEAQANQVVSWFNENNELVAENTTTFLPTIAGNYYAIARDPNTQCESPQSELFLAALGVGVSASITAEQEQICPRTTTTLTANGGNQFLWSTGANTSTITVSPGTYELTVTNEEGCTGTTSITIEAFPNFEVNITGEAQICEGELSTLIASGGSQYRWNTNATSPTIQVGTGNYSVTITSENGCEKITTFTVEEYPDFEVNITGAAQVCEDELSTLTASGGSQYRWNTNATSPNIQVGAGNYSVTITSENGCEKITNFTVEEYPDFEVSITGEAQVCEDELSTLTASGGSQYRWNTNATSPTIQAVAGNYNVTITSENGCEKIASFTVEEYPDFEVNVTGEEQVCEGELSMLTANGGSQYRWNTNVTSPNIQVGAGNYSVTITSENGCEKVANFTVEEYPDFEINVTGEAQVCEGELSTLTASGGSQYRWNTNATSSTIQVGEGSYSVTITSENGCKKVASFTVEEYPDFEVSITGEAQVCEGELSTLTASGGSQYRWNTNSTSPTIQATAGSYSVTITNENGCEKVVSFTVEEYPDFEVSITGEEQVCEGELSTLTASGGSQYRWNTNATSPNIQVGAGNYSVTITNENGCEKVANFTVEEYPDFEVSITGEEQVCEGGLSMLTASGGSQYRWSTNATSSTIQAGLGNYSVTVTSENGCEKVATFAVGEYPDFEVDIMGKNMVCKGESTILTATSGSNYIWSNGANTQTIDVGIGMYSVTVTNENGCQANQSITIEELSLPSLSISSSAVCASNLKTYELDIITETSNTINISNGRLIEGINGLFRIIEVPVEEDLSITITNESGCSITEIITAPECACPSIALPISNGDFSICEGEELPTLSVNATGENITVNWYDAPNDGNLLLAGSSDFNPKDAGTYYAEAISTESGCTSDLRIAVTLTVHPLPEIEVNELIFIDCNQPTGSIAVEGNEGTAPYEFALEEEDFQSSNRFEGLSAGIYDIFIRDANGCINQTSASIEAKIRKDRQRLTQYTCDAEKIGVDTSFFINEFGCDSLIITSTLDGRTMPTVFTENTCDPMQVNADTLFFQNQFGCDSLIITRYNLVASDTTFLSGTTCDATTAGERVLNLENQFGCDSVVVINTVFSDKDVLFIDKLTCNPTQIGVDTSSFINQLGCDSLIITTTALQGENDTTRFRIATCDFNSIGFDTLLFSNQSGCDSLIITERFFSFPTPPVIDFSGELSVCEGDTAIISTSSYESGLQWIRNDEEIDGANKTQLLITQGGIYRLSYTNEEGCAVVSNDLTFTFLDAPEQPIFTNENNLLVLENQEAFEEVDLQWFFEGMPIEGATKTTYCSSASGGHSLVATDPNTNCSTAFALFIEYDETIENCVVNAKNTIEDIAIQVYPNPFQDYFNIELNGSKIANLQVFNLLGQRLYQHQLTGQRQHTISSEDWVAGIYYLSIEIEKRRTLIKLVKVD